jgi:alkanesulfonate monooxygenase SsuD/methylene tetrahydromethanopterin reductase-like flavin-dependent oxidoreductase (luciferase family)
MLPNRTTTSSPSSRANIPVWMLAAGGAILALSLLCGWVLIGMGNPPETQAIQAEIPLKI